MILTQSSQCTCIDRSVLTCTPPHPTPSQDDVLTADLDNSDFYGYGYSREAMTCITSVDGMTEECILSSPGAGFDGSIEAWYVRVG